MSLILGLVLAQFLPSSLPPLSAAPAPVLVPAAVAQARPLRILLTNDDGFDSNGLKVMHAALVAAGHRVTVVAPATNQSATSMSMTSGVLRLEDQGHAVWAVHGTPADAVILGLQHILRDSRSTRATSRSRCSMAT